MPPIIDETKLRRFHADAKAAHAALTQAGSRVNAARQDVARATVELQRWQKPGAGYRKVNSDDRTGGKRGNLSKPGTPDHEKIAADALRRAEMVLTKAEEEHDRLEDAWENASRIWNRCKEFAAAHDVLPADLQD